jgi:hypothetical protein
LTICGLVTLYAKYILTSRFCPAVSISLNIITSGMFQLPGMNSESFLAILYRWSNVWLCRNFCICFVIIRFSGKKSFWRLGFFIFYNIPILTFRVRENFSKTLSQTRVRLHINCLKYLRIKPSLNFSRDVHKVPSIKFYK